MHILFLTDNFPPEVNAPASRTWEHCRIWARGGHRVTVITCAPNFPTGRVFDGYRNRLWQKEEMDGIEVIRVWSYVTANEGFARRILDYMSFMVTAFLASLFVRRVDVVVGTSPQFFTACAAFATAAAKRRPWIFELRDLWPESIRAVDAMQSSRILDALEKLELFLYRRATAVVSVTCTFKENLISRKIDGGKIHVITNGVDMTRFRPMPKDKALLADLGLQGKFVAGYIGTIGAAHGLETLLEAARRLKEEPERDDIRILLLGGGAERRRLEALSRSMALDNVLFLDFVPKSEVVRYWSILDASIIHLKDEPLFETVIPSKLFECMGMGIPVIHGVRGESCEIVQRHDMGLVCQPGNAAALVDALRRLQARPDLRGRLAANALAASAAYDRERLASEMLSVIKAIAAGRAAGRGGSVRPIGPVVGDLRQVSGPSVRHNVPANSLPGLSTERR